jgi:DNA-binding MarR family transcriptional regulator
MMNKAVETDYAGDAGPALIFADSDAGAKPYAEAVTAIGGRVGAILGIDQLYDRLDFQSHSRLVIVDIADPAAVGIEHLVGRVEHFSAEADAASIFAIPIDALDRAAGASHGQRTTLLCDPDPADKLAAVSLAWAEPELRMWDSAADIDTIRLKRLADEVHRIARALNGLSSVGDAGIINTRAGLSGSVSDMLPGFSAQPSELIGFGAPDANEVRNVLRLRRLRDRFFDSELFADPAWDILLDLLAARIEGDQVAVSSLCIAAAVPPTTALRWIKTMTDTGLLERHADPMDGRRIFIRLTEKAAEAMSRYFTAARRMSGMMI